MSTNVTLVGPGSESPPGPDRGEPNIIQTMVSVDIPNIGKSVCFQWSSRVLQGFDPHPYHKVFCISKSGKIP